MKRSAPAVVACVAAVLFPATAWAEGEAVEPAEPAAASTPADALPDGFVKEADLPEGFPAPGPADRATLKHYPTYRAAWADGRDGNAFGRLFRHIQRNDIAMTTPVEMPVAVGNDGEPTARVEGMAFLYADPQMKSAGDDPRDSTVTVRDTPAEPVVSYGFFGNPSPQRIELARTAITQHLAEHENLTSTDRWRLLGYNSPMVPPQRRFFELQVVVETTTK